MSRYNDLKGLLRKRQDPHEAHLRRFRRSTPNFYGLECRPDAQRAPYIETAIRRERQRQKRRKRIIAVASGAITFLLIIKGAMELIG